MTCRIKTNDSDDNDDSDNDADEEDENEQPQLDTAMIRHNGAVNRIRVIE